MTPVRSSFSLALLLLLCWPLLASGQGRAPSKDFKWQVLTVGGRDYVPAKDLAEFYGFQQFRDAGSEVRFFYQSPGLRPLEMIAKADSQTLIINKIKFITSFRMIRDGQHLLISRMDLAKLIDPIIRPSHRKGPEALFNTVIIDPGHGGSDSGAVCSLGEEADFALDTARHLAGYLKQRGFKVYLTRNEDRFITLGQRVEFANKFSKAILVSLHYNSGQSRATGIETFALTPQGSSSTFTGQRSSDGKDQPGNSKDSENIALATAIHASALLTMRPVDRGVKRARWSVLTGLKLPGVLFEGGFVSNPGEAQRISTVRYRQQVARAMCEGIVNYREAVTKN